MRLVDRAALDGQVAEAVHAAATARQAFNPSLDGLTRVSEAINLPLPKLLKPVSAKELDQLKAFPTERRPRRSRSG